MAKSREAVHSIGNYGMELEPGHLYGVLTYRGELASWNWAFFVPNPTVSPIGSLGTLFHVVNASDMEWKFEIETKDVVTSPHIVAIIQLAKLSQFQDSNYEDIVGDSEGSLRSMFQMVPIPMMGSSSRRAEFSSRTWFLDAIIMLDDCGVVVCDDVWPLEREIRRLGFTAMDNYLENKGMQQ